MDTTATFNCLQCNKKFHPSSTYNVYCSYICQQEYMVDINKVKRYQRAADLEFEIRTKAWKRNTIGLMTKFYEVFGKNYDCDICNKTFEQNVKEYGVPLHMIMKPGIQDYRVMDENNWMRYCTKCFSNIQFQRQKDEK